MELALSTVAAQSTLRSDLKSATCDLSGNKPVGVLRCRPPVSVPQRLPDASYHAEAHTAAVRRRSADGRLPPTQNGGACAAMLDWSSAWRLAGLRRTAVHAASTEPRATRVLSMRVAFGTLGPALGVGAVPRPMLHGSVLGGSMFGGGESSLYADLVGVLVMPAPHSSAARASLDAHRR